MKILALDCSTEWCSVAVLSQHAGHNEIVERSEQASRKHTQYLLPMVDKVLADAQTALGQIDAIAFACGPGSFTGLRICLGAVQGLAFGAGLPVIPVSTLKAQAHGALDLQPSQRNPAAGESLAPEDMIISTLDARMDEVYWAAYRVTGDRLLPMGDERLTAPEGLAFENSQFKRPQFKSLQGTGNILALGSGYSYRERMPAPLQSAQWLPQVYPKARSVAQLAVPELERGAVLPAEQAAPVYLRDEVAWQKQTPVAL